MDDSRPLRLLSLDGGGIRGLSSLYILRAIMRVLERELNEEGAVKQPARGLLPCEYFDLIAGTSTGGLIAVMLGVLRMDIDTCIEEYLRMAPVIFPVENLISGSRLGQLLTITRGQQRFDPKPLEDAIKGLVAKHLGEKAATKGDVPLRFETSRSNKSLQCKVFVCVTSEKLGKHFRFRSYESSWNDTDGCPIWQACRATSAAPTFFPPMLIGNPPTAYVDGGLGYNNPIRPLLDEARHIWGPTRDIGCIVSIGTGILTSRDIGRTIKLLFESLKDIATDTERVARDFREEMKHRYGVEQKIYFRFNVQHGLEQVALEEWKEMDRTKVATQEYIGEQWSQIQACASQLRNPTVAPSSPAKPAFIVPFEQDNDFVGREDVIKKIHIQFQTNRRRVALSGLGGVGKSQIAIEYAHRFKQQHHQVFWVHAGSRSRFDQAYQSVAEKLKIPGFDKPEVDTRQLVHKWLNDEAHGNWLMILDNADDAELFFPEPVLDSPPDENKSPSGLASYIPRNSKGSILITTRNSILGKDLANDNTPIEIEQFSPPDAEILLKSKIPGNCWNAADAGKLVEALGCLPLAITQSAAYVSNYNVSLKEYLAEVENDDLNLKECLSEELQDPRRELGSPNAVFRTWMLSFNQIRRQNHKAAQILSLMALLDRQGIPKSLLRKENDQFVEFSIAIGTLQAFSLIRAETGGETFVMHRLVQLSTQNWLEKEGTHVVYREEAVKMLSASFPDGNVLRTWKTCETLLPHAQAVLKYSNTTDSSRLDRAKLLFNVAWYNLHHGGYEVAHTYGMECYKIRWRLLDRNDLKFIDCLKLLGWTLLIIGSYEAAEVCFREALLEIENVFGKECEEALSCQERLAHTFIRQGKYVAAGKIYQQVLEAREKRLGTNHPDTLSSIKSLGSLFAEQGKHDAAEEWLRRALKGLEETVGWLDPRALVAASELVLILGSQRKFDDAYSLYQRTCVGLKEIYGPDYQLTLRVSREYSKILGIMRKEESSQQEPEQLDNQSERKLARG